jgi:hypothetical protein
VAGGEFISRFASRDSRKRNRIGYFFGSLGEFDLRGQIERLRSSSILGNVGGLESPCLWFCSRSIFGNSAISFGAGAGSPLVNVQNAWCYI